MALTVTPRANSFQTRAIPAGQTSVSSQLIWEITSNVAYPFTNESFVITQVVIAPLTGASATLQSITPALGQTNVIYTGGSGSMGPVYPIATILFLGAGEWNVSLLIGGVLRGTVRIEVTDGAGTTDPTTDPTANASDGNLTWFQAEAELLAGSRIRRAGWTLKYIVIDRGIPMLQTIDATTGSLSDLVYLTADNFTAAEFRATDWTLTGIAGQPTTAGLAAAQIPSDLRFP